MVFVALASLSCLAKMAGKSCIGLWNIVYVRIILRNQNNCKKKNHARDSKSEWLNHEECFMGGSWRQYNKPLDLLGSSEIHLDSSVTRENILPSRSSSTRHGPTPPRTATANCAYPPSQTVKFPPRSDAEGSVGSTSIQVDNHCPWAGVIQRSRNVRHNSAPFRQFAAICPGNPDLTLLQHFFQFCRQDLSVPITAAKAINYGPAGCSRRTDFFQRTDIAGSF